MQMDRERLKETHERAEGARSPRGQEREIRAENSP